MCMYIYIYAYVFIYIFLPAPLPSPVVAVWPPVPLSLTLCSWGPTDTHRARVPLPRHEPLYLSLLRLLLFRLFP